MSEQVKPQLVWLPDGLGGGEYVHVYRATDYDALHERVSVPKRQTLNNLARDGELIASGWNACLDEFNRLNPSIEQVSSLLEWAVGRWEAEVSLRPLHNVHRRTLDDTWRQVIRRIGGNDKALCGPTHDELLASHQRGER